MRDACFRGKRIKRPGWEKDVGEWVEGGIAFDPGGTYITQWNSYGMGFIDCIPVDPATVGQFVGRNDKRGHGIFDGDFLKDNLGNIFLVDYCSDWAAFRAKLVWGKGEDGKFTRFLAGSHSFIGTNWKEGEIVGNVHDMPDLVEREERKDG